jgi:SAM-dependent methyltransferase
VFLALIGNAVKLTAMLPDTLPLPPQRLRFMGEEDTLFLRIADEMFRLLQRLGFNAESTVLDIGSGYGRLAYGILNHLDFRGSYVGLDILPAQVGWCRENIRNALSQFQFRLVDMRNDRYNPSGKNAVGEFCLDLPVSAFDFCTLFSVFTHMYEDDIRHYLSEVRRLLRVNGTAVTTFFLFDKDRLEQLRKQTSGLLMRHVLNEHTRYYNPEDRLHAIGYDREWAPTDD